MLSGHHFEYIHMSPNRVGKSSKIDKIWCSKAGWIVAALVGV